MYLSTAFVISQQRDRNAKSISKSWRHHAFTNPCLKSIQQVGNYLRGQVLLPTKHIIPEYMFEAFTIVLWRPYTDVDINCVQIYY